MKDNVKKHCLNTRCRRVLRDIVWAQKCSDNGKDIWDFEPKCSRPSILKDGLCGYEAKDALIAEAIRVLDQNPYFGVTYYVAPNKEYSEYTSCIVYFNVAGFGQVSFHEFRRDIRAKIGKGHTTVWQDWQQSQDVCRRLDNFLASIE